MRQNTANADIRQAAQSKGIYLWRIADALGISDKTLTAWMRRELPDEMKARIFQIIERIAGE